MVSLSLTLTPVSSSATLLSFKTPPTSTLSTLKRANSNSHRVLYRDDVNRRGCGLVCRNGLSNEAPFYFAISTCMLSSLFLATPANKEEEAERLVDSTDTRFGVMGIISFIPFFNWLSWVFAWLDTGKRRYAVYAIVYLLPYLRSNLSLSPDDSLLPIASIIFCIVHIQLEASIRNGDLQGFQLFNMAAKHLSSMNKDKANHFEGRQEIFKEERKKEHSNGDDESDDDKREHT